MNKDGWLESCAAVAYKSTVNPKKYTDAGLARAEKNKQMCIKEFGKAAWEKAYKDAEDDAQ